MSRVIENHHKNQTVIKVGLYVVFCHFLNTSVSSTWPKGCWICILKSFFKYLWAIMFGEFRRNSQAEPYEVHSREFLSSKQLPSILRLQTVNVRKRQWTVLNQHKTGASLQNLCPYLPPRTWTAHNYLNNVFWSKGKLDFFWGHFFIFIINACDLHGITVSNCTLKICSYVTVKKKKIQLWVSYNL